MSTARPALRREDWICLLALLGLIFLCLWDTVLLGRTLALRDVHSLFGPQHDFLRASILRGELPLWNPHLYSGHPFLANPQSGVCYPLTYATLLLSTRTWLHVTIGLHMFILGAGLYVFARDLGVGRVAALWAASVFMLSGLPTRLWEFVPQFQATAWMPFAFVFLRRLVFRRRTRDAVLLGIMLALQLTAGHPYPLFFTVLGLAVCAIAWIGRDASDTGDISLKTIGRLVLALLIFIGLSAVQWLPLRELLNYHVPPESWRPTLSKGFSLHPAEWIVLLIPTFFGFPAWQKCFYMGLLPLVLIPLAFKRRPGVPGYGADIMGLSVLTVLGLGLALGDHIGLLDTMRESSAPIARMLKWPSSAMLLFVFGGSVLSGVGLDRLLAADDRRIILVACPAIGMGLLAVLAIAAPVQPLLETLRATYGARLVVYAAQAVQGENYPLSGAIVRFAIMAAISILALIFFACRKQRLSIAMLFFVMGVDLLVHCRETTVFLDQNIYARTPPALQGIVDHTKAQAFTRVLHTFPTGVNDLAYGSRAAAEYDVLRGAAVGAIGIPYGLYLAGGVGPLAPFRTIALARAPELLPPADRERIYRLFSIGVVTRVDPIALGMYEASTATIADPLPRAYLVANHLRVGSDREVVTSILAADHDPRARVVLSSLRPLDLPSAPGRPAGVVESVADQGDVLVVKLHNAGDALLVLTDSYDPGWTAMVDGRPAQIYRANLVQRAVEIPAGTKEVVFRYRPRSVIRGAWISGLTVAGILFGGFMRRRGAGRDRRSRRKESPPPAAPSADPPP